MWPDLAKFCHFGKRVKIFCNFLRVSIFWTYFGKFSSLLDQCCSKCPNIGSGGGWVGSAVASKSRGLRFESSHQQKLILNIYCQPYWKDENKEKEAGNGPFFNVQILSKHSRYLVTLDLLKISRSLHFSLISFLERKKFPSSFFLVRARGCIINQVPI